MKVRVGTGVALVVVEGETVVMLGIVDTGAVVFIVVTEDSRGEVDGGMVVDTIVEVVPETAVEEAG